MKKTNKKRSWKQIVSILSCIVVFCTTYALILPAVTMSKETYCGKEEHTHTENCYVSETPLCGKEEAEASEGHVHDETCYEEVRNLICGLEESETHVHTDECYETTTTQTCGKEESEPTEGHTHSDECYKSEELQCGKEEHEHTRICESNKEDVEDPKTWDEAYKDINDEKDAKTRILTVAKNELGTKENKNNFEIDEEEKEHYYTRYGHLYEDQYGDWNNYFTGYVLKYANVQMSYDKDASKWQNKTIHDQKEEGEEGNVVFFRNDKGELRTGIVTSIDDLKKEIRVIEGDVEGEVKEERVNKDKVIAYLNDQIEIMEEDTPLAGEGLNKEELSTPEETPKEDTEESKENSLVFITGQENAVEVGDIVTLSANVDESIDPATYTYQWQYNENRSGSDEWKNIDGKTEQLLQVTVSEENKDFLWRVLLLNATQDQNEPEVDAGVPMYSQPKIMPKLQASSLFEEEVSSETSGDEVIGSSDEVSFKLGKENNAFSEDLVITNKIGNLVLQKSWTDRVGRSTVKVELRYNPSGEFGNNRQPIDPNNTELVKDNIELSILENWQETIKVNSLPEKFKNLIDENPNNINKFYLVEKTEPGADGDEYVQTYSLKIENVEGYQVQFKKATQIENGKKYAIASTSDNKRFLYLNGAGVNQYTIKNFETEMQLDNDFSSYLWEAHVGNGKVKFAYNNQYLNINTKGFLGIGDDNNQWTCEKQTNGNWSVYQYYNNNNRYIQYNSKFKLTTEKGSIQLYEVEVSSIDNAIFAVENTQRENQGSSGGGSTNPEEVIHTKSIDWLGDSDQNVLTTLKGEDAYRLYLDAGPIAGDSPIDLIFVIDTSNSMDYTIEGSKKSTEQENSRMHILRNLLKGENGIAAKFINVNKNNDKSKSNTVSIVTFNNNSNVALTNSNNPKEIDDALDTVKTAQTNGNSSIGGTNYEAGLEQAKTMIKTLSTQNGADKKKMVIFLSDGLPTKSDNHGDGMSTTSQIITDTQNAITNFQTNPAHKNVIVSTIAFAFNESNGTVPGFLANGYGLIKADGASQSTPVKGMVMNGGGAYSSNDTARLQEQLYLLTIGPRCLNGKISDTLSPYVKLADNPNIQVNIYKNTNQSDRTNLYTLTQLNGTPTWNSEEIPTADPLGKPWKAQEAINSVEVTNNNKTISVNFNPEWRMDATYRYELSFDVVVVEVAYQKYISNKEINSTWTGYETNGEGTTNQGSINSDYECPSYKNHTSENENGFFSNDSSEWTYTYLDKTYTTDASKANGENVIGIKPYEEPVVQVHVPTANVVKRPTGSNDKTLAGAVFDFYRKTDDVTSGDKLNQPSVDELKETAKLIKTGATTDENGMIMLGELLPGARYYLVETSAPAGYNRLIYYLQLDVSKDKSTLTITKIDKEGNILADENGNKEVETIDISKNSSNIEVTVYNNPGQSLPNTGGTGTQLFTFSGGAIIATSSLMYGYKKRSKRNKTGKGGK